MGMVAVLVGAIRFGDVGLHFVYGRLWFQLVGMLQHLNFGCSLLEFRGY